MPPAPRRYTLTHNDLTGELQLSVGGAFNMAQISSWYNRLIRCAFGLSLFWSWDSFVQQKQSARYHNGRPLLVCQRHRVALPALCH